MSRRAILDLTENGLIVCSCSRTVDGLFVLGEWVVAISNHADDIELTTAIRNALENARYDVNISDPESLSKPEYDKRLQLAKKRSYKQFYSNTREVLVVQESADQVVEFIPTKNLGRKEGIQPLEDQTVVTPPNFCDGSVGRAARAALELAPIYRVIR